MSTAYSAEVPEETRRIAQWATRLAVRIVQNEIEKTPTGRMITHFSLLTGDDD